MVFCELCGRKISSERGLNAHISRYHKAYGKWRVLFEKTLLQFFPLLEERKWSAAERLVNQIEEMKLDEKWRAGYANALMGMIDALRDRSSSVQPYILEASNYDEDELRDAQKSFRVTLQRPLNTSFERGYFQAWSRYIKYLLHNTKKESLN